MRHRESSTPKESRKDWAWAISTVCGVGHLRPAPGTWGSAVALLAWVGGTRVLPEIWRTPVTLIAVVAATAFGIPAATREERRRGDKDPSHIVIDEVAGQWLALAAAPAGWQTAIAGFILFRVFDVLKPPPVRQLERLPAGTGIVLDDLGAGAYAFAVLQVLVRTGILPR